MALLFFDDFNYAVSKTEGGSAAETAFVAGGGWTSVKTSQERPPESAAEIGRLYTVTSIPDLSLPWPNGHARALCIDCAGMEDQGDLYLNYGKYTGGDGAGTVTTNFIPGDVWFQWWQLTPHTATQPSQVTARNKWIYPTRDTFPSSTQRWLVELGAQSSEPHNAQPFGVPSDGEQFIVSRDHSDDNEPVYSLAAPGDTDKLGPFRTDIYITPNVWWQVKVHYNTSGVGPNSFEAWIRPHGGSWTKVCEWIHGVTDDFTWVNSLGTDGGHVAFNFPQSIPGNAIGAGPDQWHYVQDFAMADAEEDLPTYNDAAPAAVGHPVLFVGVV